MKQPFQKIWQLALPFQDQRDDLGHAQIVTNFAIKLCQIEKANDSIVIPAAILHDIGWSQLSPEERFLVFSPTNTPETEFSLRLKHQDLGVKLAEDILIKSDYPQKYHHLILEIISQHDTRNNFLSPEDGAMRDADKLWRYTDAGFKADIRRYRCSLDFEINKAFQKINQPSFFFFESSRKIALKEIENRRTHQNLSV